MCQKSKLNASLLLLKTYLKSSVQVKTQRGTAGHISQFTLVMVLTPHEDAAPVRQVIRDDREPVPPRLHYSLHVVQAGVAAQVGRLKTHVDLSSLLQLNNLLGSLCVKEKGARTDETLTVDTEHPVPQKNFTQISCLRLASSAWFQNLKYLRDYINKWSFSFCLSKKPGRHLTLSCTEQSQSHYCSGIAGLWSLLEKTKKWVKWRLRWLGKKGGSKVSSNPFIPKDKSETVSRPMCSCLCAIIPSDKIQEIWTGKMPRHYILMCNWLLTRYAVLKLNGNHTHSNTTIYTFYD